jgi:hypothetical protein
VTTPHRRVSRLDRELRAGCRGMGAALTIIRYEYNVNWKWPYHHITRPGSC